MSSDLSAMDSLRLWIAARSFSRSEQYLFHGLAGRPVLQRPRRSDHGHKRQGQLSKFAQWVQEILFVPCCIGASAKSIGGDLIDCRFIAGLFRTQVDGGEFVPAWRPARLIWSYAVAETRRGKAIRGARA